MPVSKRSFAWCRPWPLVPLHGIRMSIHRYSIGVYHRGVPQLFYVLYVVHSVWRATHAHHVLWFVISLILTNIRPERWVKGGITGSHNTGAYVLFAYGPGVCTGKPVAVYNMKWDPFQISLPLRRTNLRQIVDSEFRQNF